MDYSNDELKLDSKLFSTATVENITNKAHIDRKNKTKYANLFDPEKELHPENVEFMQQMQR